MEILGQGLPPGSAAGNVKSFLLPLKASSILFTLSRRENLLQHCPNPRSRRRTRFGANDTATTRIFRVRPTLFHPAAPFATLGARRLHRYFAIRAGCDHHLEKAVHDIAHENLFERPVALPAAPSSGTFFIYALILLRNGFFAKSMDCKLSRRNPHTRTVTHEHLMNDTR